MKYTFDQKQHIHALDGEPLNGTTTVIKNVMPPFLAKWGAQCAVDYIKENIDSFHGEVWGYDGEDEVHEWTWNGEEFFKILERAVNAWSKVRKEKADIGTEMHAHLEEYVKTCIQSGNGDPKVAGGGGDKFVQEFAGWAQENVKRFIHSEVDVYSKELWLGGQLDVVYEKLDGTFAIGDFKSNEKAYFNMFLQCAMYDVQQKENGFYIDTGEKVGEPLNISTYTVFAFGKGMTVHEYQANEKMFDGVKALVTLNNLLPK